MNPLKSFLTFMLLMATLFGLGQTPTSITKDQRSKLDAYMKSLDSKILESFKSAPALKTEMESKLKLINDEKDSSVKLTMVRAYQKKYLPAYMKVLASAGLTPKSITNDLQAILPQYQFKVDSLLNFSGSSTGTMQIMSSNSSTNATNTRMTFDLTKSVSCGGLAGGYVTNRSNRIRAKSVSGVLGGCTADGTYSSTFTMPSYTNAILICGYTLHGDGLAVGVVGSAGVITDVYFDGITATGTGNWNVLLNHDNVSTMSLAPAFWVSYDEEESIRPQRYITIPAGTKTLETRVHVMSSTVSLICCGSYGTAEASRLDFIVSYQ